MFQADTSEGLGRNGGPINSFVCNVGMSEDVMRVVVTLLVLAASAGSMLVETTAAGPVKRWDVTPTSLVSRHDPPLQRIELSIDSAQALDGAVLRIWSEADRLLAEQSLGALREGTNEIALHLEEPKEPIDTRWVLSAGEKVLAQQTLKWNPPRHWTLYVLKSAHVDIGLHDSQYKQRRMGVDFIDQARELADQTSDWPEASRFRFVIEGLWWWLNYPQDRSEHAANEVVKKYVRPAIFDIGGSHSGNHTQAYGTEELCRSTYYLREFRKRWNLPAETMLMVDNNGITWPLVTAYADAGIRYLAFLPNAWNPDIKKEMRGWGADASRDHMGAVEEGGGSRIDVGWDSALPHLFYWQGPDDKRRLLVWTSPTYTSAGHDFGIQAKTPEIAQAKMARQLAKLESRYPYDLWLVSFYRDNEAPNLGVPSFAKEWNARWQWPEVRTVGNLTEPFKEVEERFGDQIPTLSGMITGGWAQHPVSTPSLLAMKRSADRLLPVAEKLATLARLADPDYVYPTIALRRAWDALICNDEHGYGTSYYKGRPVYDTWMQKRAWIEQGLATAETESARALKTLAGLAPADGPSIFVFNPTLQERSETVEVELPESLPGTSSVRCPDGTVAPACVADGKLRFRTPPVPPMGYAVFPLVGGNATTIESGSCPEPPSIENDFYRVEFCADGSITGIFDKQLKRQLVDASAPYRCNQLVFTRDMHESFSSPDKAQFAIEKGPLGQTVIACIDDPTTGAAIEQRVALPTHEKRIDIDNRLDHVRELASKDRWRRFGYYAFPFDVPESTFRVGLNGCSADPYRNQTGHGTTAYHAARDWSYVGNGQFGITLVQFDSQLVECGAIHKRKNILREQPDSSHLYSYVFNDWLYAHAYVTGPSHINLHYRYVITSSQGSFQKAKPASFAERAVTPVLATVIPQTQAGKLPAASHSFLSVDAPNVSLLALKLRETRGRGVIARLHETTGRRAEAVKVTPGWGQNLCMTGCSLFEQQGEPVNQQDLQLDPFGFATIRIEEQGSLPSAPQLAVDTCTDKSVALRWEPVASACQYHVYRGEEAGFAPDEYHLLAITTQPNYTDDWLSPDTAYCYRVAAVTAGVRQGAVSDVVRARTGPAGNSPPAKVGTGYTGLISVPKAWRGDSPDTLYLQWGQNVESDLSHYELYRGNTPDFEAGDKTFLSNVKPGPYVVVPFEDTGLKPHTTYFYRVRAVDRDGHKGELSDLCRGVTREIREEH